VRDDVLSEAIGAVLPAAVGVALSPIPIIAVILMLGTPRARTNGPAFALGWVLGLTVVSVIVLLLASGADDPDSTSADTVEWGKVLLGLLFLGLARRTWRGRPKHGEPATMPKWMTTVDHFTPVRSLVLGVGLSAVNPKNLALTLAAAAAVAQSGLSAEDSALAIAVFVVLGSVTTAGAVLFYLVARERAERPLAAVREFMTQHNAAIMVVILLVLGAKLIGDGIGGL
jgi:threonine/homoserine/homoserine lactone efflux protein